MKIFRSSTRADILREAIMAGIRALEDNAKGSRK